MVSIIIPAYNTSRYVQKCLQSIKEQTYEDWECIIVDDCSTDDTFNIIKDFTDGDKRFKLFKNEENLGCGLARRRAISLGHGEWYSFIDSDDYVDARFLETMLNACKQYNAEVSICGTMNRDEHYEYLGQDIAEREYVAAKEELYRQYMLSSWVKQYNGNKLYARRVIDAVEYSPLRYCEDSATTYKWLWEANFAVVLPQAMYNYIHHLDSNSNKGNEPLRKAVDTCLCVYDHYLFCKAQGFTWMLERLKTFVTPHLVAAVRGLDINSMEFKVVNAIREMMF